MRRVRLQYLQEAHARQAHETSALGLGKQRHRARWSRATDGGTGSRPDRETGASRTRRDSSQLVNGWITGDSWSCGPTSD